MSESTELNVSPPEDEVEVYSITASPSGDKVEVSSVASPTVPEKSEIADVTPASTSEVSPKLDKTESELTSGGGTSSLPVEEELGSTEATGDVLSSPEPTSSDRDSLLLAGIESPEKKDVFGESTDDDLLFSPPKVEARPRHSPIRPPSDSPKKTVSLKEHKKDSPHTPPDAAKPPVRTRKYSPILPPQDSPERRELRGNRRSFRLTESKGSDAEVSSSSEVEKAKATPPKKGTVISLKKTPQDKKEPSQKIVLKRNVSPTFDEEPARKIVLKRPSVEEGKIEEKKVKQDKDEVKKPMQGEKRKAGKGKCEEGKPQASKDPDDNPPKKRKITPISWP